MLIMSTAVCKPTNSLHSKWNNSVKIMREVVTGVLHCVISVTWVSTCGPGKQPIRIWIGPMRVFYTPIEGDISWEHRGLVFELPSHVRLVADWVMCMRKNCGAWTTTCSYLAYQWTGLLVHWEWWLCEKIEC